jgi:hypothetical protein
VIIRDGTHYGQIYLCVSWPLIVFLVVNFVRKRPELYIKVRDLSGGRSQGVNNFRYKILDADWLLKDGDARGAADVVSSE